jgi:hypothetical protein
VTTDDIKALVDQLRIIAPHTGYSRTVRQAATALAALSDRLEIATQELKNIANADTIAWDDPTEYEAWAKSRARWALGKVEREKP